MDYRNVSFEEYNNYYELNIDYFDQLVSELQTTIFENINVDDTSVYYFGNSDAPNPFDKLPSILKLKDQLQLPTDTKFMVNCIGPHSSMDPHIDNSDNPWAILIPIKNTKNTRLEYYTTSTDPVLKTYTNQLGQTITTWEIDPKSLTTTDSIELTRPTAINNQRIHAAINPNDTSRWTIALVCAGLGWDPMLAKDYFCK